MHVKAGFHHGDTEAQRKANWIAFLELQSAS